MKAISRICGVVLFALLVTVLVSSGGCLSTDPGKAQQTINHWVPAGTSEADAIKILKHHGFDCQKQSETDYTCIRMTKIMKNSWFFHLTLKDGKVVGNTTPTICNNLLWGSS
jgi:hypothetical protein